MGTEASKPLAPPPGWDEKNQCQLQIVSPTNAAVNVSSKDFVVISPTSDISNPSDVWRLHHPMAMNSEKSRPRSRSSNFFSFSSHHSLEKEDCPSKRRNSLGRRAKNKHRRIGSLTKAFGCFIEAHRIQGENQCIAPVERRTLIEI